MCEIGGLFDEEAITHVLNSYPELKINPKNQIKVKPKAIAKIKEKKDTTLESIREEIDVRSTYDKVHLINLIKLRKGVERFPSKWGISSTSTKQELYNFVVRENIK